MLSKLLLSFLFFLLLTNQILLVNADRWALIVTLAGTRKLNEYFEWSCRSIGASSSLLDMLVFHEGNERLKQMSCANNVKFINLGENGLSKLITSTILSGGLNTSISDTNRNHLTMILSDLIVHIPRYLVEIKPMTGILFEKYLEPYSHWSYTDPDIIWGNLTNWIDVADTKQFEIVSLCKTMDAGRLFLRGQVSKKKIPYIIYYIRNSYSYNSYTFPLFNLITYICYAMLCYDMLWYMISYINTSSPYIKIHRN